VRQLFSFLVLKTKNFHKEIRSLLYCGYKNLKPQEQKTYTEFQNLNLKNDESYLIKNADKKRSVGVRDLKTPDWFHFLLIKRQAEKIISLSVYSSSYARTLQ